MLSLAMQFQTRPTGRSVGCKSSRKSIMLDSKTIEHVVDGAVCLTAAGAVTGSISIDTRQNLSQQWYLCLRGKNHDGHAFARDALTASSVGVIIDQEHIESLPDKASSLVSLAQSDHKGLVVVPDTEKALQELAVNARAGYQGAVIAVTGSVGKTTCKSMISHTLAAFQLDVSEAPESYNNHVGVALTALGMPLDSKVAVFEIGSSQQGEVAALSSVVKPHIRVISDVQPSHLAGFATQDLAAVLDEKLQLFKLAQPTDALVFNAANRGVWNSVTDPFGIGAATRSTLEQSIWAFGVEDDLCSATMQELTVSLPGLAVIIAKDIKCTLQQLAGSCDWVAQTGVKLFLHECGQQQVMGPCCDVDVDTDAESTSHSIEVCVPALGKPLGVNAALAVATACAWMHRQQKIGAAPGSGIPYSSRRIAQEVMLQLNAHAWLHSWSSPPGRMTMHQLSENIIVLDDSYNANPASMMSALHTIRDLQVTCSGGVVATRRLCVLGCMAELGSKEQDYHQQVFDAVAGLKETSAVLWGGAWRNLVVDSQPAAQDSERIQWCGNAEDVCAVTMCVLEWIVSGKVESDERALNIVMLKGSRIQQVESVLEQLQQRQL